MTIPRNVQLELSVDDIIESFQTQIADLSKRLALAEASFASAHATNEHLQRELQNLQTMMEEVEARNASV